MSASIAFVCEWVGGGSVRACVGGFVCVYVCVRGEWGGGWVGVNVVMRVISFTEVGKSVPRRKRFFGCVK